MLECYFTEDNKEGNIKESYIERVAMYNVDDTIANVLGDDRIECIVRVGQHVAKTFEEEISLSDITMILWLIKGRLEHDIEQSKLESIGPQEKLYLIKEIFNYVLDHTITEGVIFDIVSDPVIKYVVDLSLAVLLPETFNDTQGDFDIIEDQKVTSKLVKASAMKVVKIVGKTICLKDVRRVLLLTTKLTQGCTGFDKAMKIKFAKKVFDRVLDVTDFKGYPDFIFDPLFKVVYEEVLAFLF